MFPIDRPPALVYTMGVKRKGGIVVYLMYDDEGNFMGVLNEHLGHNLLMNNRDFLFVKIPESLYFDEDEDEWKMPADFKVVF